MAAARNNLSRRAVLGAAFAAPTILGAGPTDAVAHAEDRAQWEAALAGLRQADSGEEAFRARQMYAADRAFHAIRRRWPIDYDFSRDSAARAEVRAAMAAYKPLECRLNDLHSVRLEAIQHLLKIRAPDLPALATKIALTVDYEVYELEDGEECMAALKSDAMRLARTGPESIRRL